MASGLVKSPRCYPSWNTAAIHLLHIVTYSGFKNHAVLITILLIQHIKLDGEEVGGGRLCSVIQQYLWYKMRYHCRPTDGRSRACPQTMVSCQKYQRYMTKKTQQDAHKQETLKIITMWGSSRWGIYRILSEIRAPPVSSTFPCLGLISDSNSV